MMTTAALKPLPPELDEPVQGLRQIRTELLEEARRAPDSKTARSLRGCAGDITRSLRQIAEFCLDGYDVSAMVAR